MTGSIALGITLIFWPLFVLGNVASIEYDLPDFCESETLSLDFTGPLRLTRNTIGSHSIKCISISSDGPHIAEGAFDGVPNLMSLDLRGNNISSQNLFSFGNISNVRILRLGDQQLRYYGEPTRITGVYPQLQYLDLSNGPITVLSSEWENPFPKLRYLDLSQNSLEELNSMDFMGQTLTHLDISDNRFSQLSLEKYGNLLSLSLDYNLFEKIGHSNGLNLRGLKSLVNLTVAKNKIWTIKPDAFVDNVNLRYLNLSMNDLQVFNIEALMNLDSLEVLSLDGNKLDSVPSGIDLNLTTISLNCNNISYLSVHSFYGLPNLRKLFLNGNTISSIHVDTFENLGQLEELHMSDNRLRYMPTRWCEPLRNLRHLDLSGNEFASFHSVFHGCPSFSVKRLYFERNPITYVDAGAFRIIPNDTTIYLNVGLVSTTARCKTDLDVQTDWN